MVNTLKNILLQSLYVFFDYCSRNMFVEFTIPRIISWQVSLGNVKLVNIIVFVDKVW